MERLQDVGAIDADDRASERERLEGAVAIVAMSGRFPGADTVAQFWDNLLRGQSALTRRPLDTLDDDVSAQERRDSSYVPVRPALDNVADFDAAFFDMNPREAELTDPQQRIFLEICWEAMERAGYVPGAETLPPVGVFAGTGLNTYFLRHVLRSRDDVARFTSGFQVENYSETIGNGADYVATRVSHKLGLTGPSFTVLSACSTSLLAVTQACQSLQLFQCDMALAGGVSISFPQARGYFATEGAMVAPDGICRPYDAAAGGTVFGSGAGVVLLKRYEDAVADGDEILAVISGYGVNNDGQRKVAFSAPSVDAQAEAIRAAYEMADIDPGTVSYVEGHGTATPLGDPIEVAALHAVLCAERDGPPDDAALACYLGSAKGNVGHLDAAAGITGLIKAAMAIHTGKLPPLANFAAPNPRFAELGDHRFQFNADLVDWKALGVPLRAGVNALGVGGTNVHVVLEAADDLAIATGQTAAVRVREPAAHDDQPVILPLSARCGPALADSAQQLADVLSGERAPSLRDAAHTLQTGRRVFEVRDAVVARTHEDAAQALRRLAGRAGTRAVPKRRSPAKLAFLLPGQGTQYPGMARALYDTEPDFKRDVDAGLDVACAILGETLREALLAPTQADDAASNAIRQTVLAQPALFIVEAAIAQHMLRAGLEPELLIGHSVGEFVAGALAGVFTFEDGLRLVCARARAMSGQPGGGMLSVRLSADALKAKLPAALDLAAVNGPKACVVAGPVDVLDAFAVTLDGEGIAARRLHTSHAFHSRMMDAAVDTIRDAASGIALNAPAIPLISTVTGQTMGPDEACSADYWAQQCRAPVLFADAIGAGRRAGAEVFLEVGPGTTLTTLARQTLASDIADAAHATQHPVFIPTLPDFDGREATLGHVAEAFAALFRSGITPNWRALEPRGGRRVALPTYPFQRKRHFIDLTTPAQMQTQQGDITEPEHTLDRQPVVASETDSLAAAVSAALNPKCEMPAPVLGTTSRTGNADVAASASAAMAADAAAQTTTQCVHNPGAAMSAPKADSHDHRAFVMRTALDVLSDLSGEDFSNAAEGDSLVALGFDSLLLGQTAQKLNRQFKTKLSLRQFRSEIGTIGELTDHLMPFIAPPSVATAVPAPEPVRTQPSPPHAASEGASISEPLAARPADLAGAPGGLDGLFREQLAAMQSVIGQQIAAATGARADVAPAPREPLPSAPAVGAPVKPSADAQSAQDPGVDIQVLRSRPEPTGRNLTPLPPLSIGGGEASRLAQFAKGGQARQREITPQQRAFISDLAESLERKLGRSKAYTQQFRKVLADPRAAAGFSEAWKELVYPVVSDRAKGAYIYDLDGNAFVDLVSGFGQNAFGHAPDFVNAAIAAQLERGYPIGPQSDLAGEVARDICEMTGNERATFCNTGSEAVMAAMRVARAVTGRDVVVFFAGGYHGQFDEVLAKRGRNRALPIAPGIPDDSLANIVVLPYDAPESLAWIRDNRDQIAAVIAEPVQSRRPGLQPVEFLRDLRVLTEEIEAALVFDEVVTGFRVHPAGMQHVFGIRADMATYGKVLGGGMPIGVLAGTSAYMDALDGGHWQYGDASIPDVPPTFFAGTFVRHPLVLAAAKAVIKHLRAGGADELAQTAERTRAFAIDMNADLERRGVALSAQQYSSWMYFDPLRADPLAALFTPLMRLKGVNAQDGFAWFFTTAHGETEMQFVRDALRETMDDLQGVGILEGDGRAAGGSRVALSEGTAKPAKPETPLALMPTEPMREVYLAAQLSDKASCAFNEGTLIRLDGALDPDALAAALDATVARHPIVCAGLGATGEQLLLPDTPRLGLSRTDLAARSDVDAALDGLVRQEQSVPFDLANGPLLRAHLVTLGPERYALILTGHHIVFDGWSAGTFISDLRALYAARVENRTPDLGTPVAPAHVLSQIAPTSAETDAYWLSRFATPPEPLQMPTDRPRPSRKTFAGATRLHTFRDGLLADVKARSRALGVTPFVVLLTAVKLLMARMSGQRDLCTAVPMAGHLLAERDDVVGHLVNFLPIRSQIAHDATVAELIAQVAEHVRDASLHQDTTLGRIVRQLKLPRAWDRTPLSDVQFNFETAIGDPDFPNVRANISVAPKTAVNFDLFFNLVAATGGDGGEKLRAEVDYSTDLFDARSVEGLLRRLGVLLEQFVAAPGDARVDTLEITTTEDADWLLDTVNATARPDADLTMPLPARIIETARAQPARRAIRSGEMEMTYGELDARSARFARSLRRRLPQRGARIAVVVERSCDLIALLLGVWRAGHVFVPLEPSHPVERLARTMKAGAVSAVVASDAALLNCAPEDAAQIEIGALLDADDVDAGDGAVEIDVWEGQQLSDDPAYIIFTSGSTGTPKGVEVSHRALTNFMLSMADAPGMGADDTLVAVTTVCFDIALLELFLPLMVGGNVVIAQRADVVDGFALVELIAKSGASVVQATPSLWQMLVEAEIAVPAGFKALSGGEPLPRDLAEALRARGAELWNMYGPTETTIWSACERVADTQLISIGLPIAHTQLVIVDQADKLVPVGVEGDLLIGGEGLANGYFARPDLTEAAFIELGFHGRTPRRWYRTGDRAVRLADGRTVMRGRRDQQIKLRGFRIELEDIEAAIRALDGVVAAAATVLEDAAGNKRIAAVYVCEGQHPPEQGVLQAQVGKVLPDYMVPTIWQQVGALPKTGNGKLDRKALPDLVVAPLAGRVGLDIATADPPPAGPANGTGETGSDDAFSDTERKIADVWSAVLGAPVISPQAQLLALGADSLHLFRIVARLRREGYAVDAAKLFDNPSVAELARMIAGQAGEATNATRARGPSLRDYAGGNKRAGRAL